MEQLPQSAGRIIFGRRGVVPHACIADREPRVRSLIAGALQDLGFINCECAQVGALSAVLEAYLPDLVIFGLSGSENEARAVEGQQDVLPGEPARQHLEEDLEACRIRGRHDQIDASAVLGRDRAVEIDVFADELRGDRGPRADRCPAGPDAVHTAEARFIGT